MGGGVGCVEFSAVQKDSSLNMYWSKAKCQGMNSLKKIFGLKQQSLRLCKKNASLEYFNDAPA